MAGATAVGEGIGTGTFRCWYMVAVPLAAPYG